MNEFHTFNEAFDALLTIQRPKSKNTYAQAKCVVEGHLRPWFGSHSLVDFEKSFEENWALYLADNADKITRKGKPRRFGHDRRYLVMALKRAQNKGIVRKSFSKKDFALNEVNEEIGRALSDDEVNRLLAALSIHPKTSLQVEISLTMGMRYSEVLKLRRDEVDLEKRVINLDANRLKTRRRRKVPVPISNQVYDRLRKQCESITGKYVFPMDRSPDEPQADNRYWWTKAREIAGVECRFHDLRHTWASNLIAMNYPQDYIVKVGGFTVQVMSRIYSHMNPESQEKFRAAFDGRFNVKTEQKVKNIVGTLLKLAEISVKARAKELVSHVL